MGKFLLLLALLMTPRADSEFVAEFAASLRNALGIQSPRMLNTARKTLFAHPSRLRQWGIINSSAAATYNSAINTIELEKTCTIRVNGEVRLRTISELKAENGHAYPSLVSTILHELAHAEYDILIEEKASPKDESLHQIFESEIRPWLSENYPHLKRGFFPNKVSIALSELFGYYRGDIVERMYGDWDTIFLYNGFNQYNETCFKRHKKLEQLAKTMPLSEFQKLLVPEGPEVATPYRDKVGVRMIWVQAQEVDLNAPARSAYKKAWDHAMWDHFAAFYRPPADMAAMVQHMQRHHPMMDKLAGCRREMWEKVQASVPASPAVSESLQPTVSGVEHR